MARVGLAAVVLAAVLTLGANAALAATVKVTPIYQKANFVGDRVVLRATPGESNEVTITQETATTLTVADRMPLDAGAGCQPLSELLVRCTVTRGASFGLDARLEDGDDSLNAAALDATYARLLGGRGDDHLAGPLESIGTIFDGGPGDDLLEGGHGPDTFREGAKRNGSDTFVGGSQADPNALLSDDQVDYGLRRRPVRVSLDGARNDGEARERDEIDRDVERVVAGKGADRMVGNGLANELVGGAGTDVLRGGAGGDHLIGDEYVRPSRHEGDLIAGGPGDDRIDGGRGDDRMSGDSGHDSFVAGPGADRIDARDGVLDAVLCKGGADRVRHDVADFLGDDCERQGKRIPAHTVPLFWADGGERLSIALGCPFRRGRACSAELTLEVAGQTFGPRPFTLQPGRYGWLFLPLGGRTDANRSPPLDGGVVTLRSTDALGRVTVESVPLSQVHREPTEISFFLPPVLPLL